MFDVECYRDSRIRVVLRHGVVCEFILSLPGHEGYWPRFYINRYHAKTEEVQYDAGGGVYGILSSPHQGKDLVELLKLLDSWIKEDEQAFLLDIFRLEETNPPALSEMLRKIPHQRLFITDYR